MRIILQISFMKRHPPIRSVFHASSFYQIHPETPSILPVAHARLPHRFQREPRLSNAERLLCSPSVTATLQMNRSLPCHWQFQLCWNPSVNVRKKANFSQLALLSGSAFSRRFQSGSGTSSIQPVSGHIGRGKSFDQFLCHFRRHNSLIVRRSTAESRNSTFT